MKKHRVFRTIAVAVLWCFTWLLAWPSLALAQQARSQNQRTLPLLASLFHRERTPKVSAEAKRMVELSRILNGALSRIQNLLKQVQQGNPAAASKIEAKARSLKGLLLAMSIHLGRVKENLSKLENKGVISAKKEQEARVKVDEAQATLDNLVSQLQGISATKSLSENQAVATQVLQNLQPILQANNPLAQQLPNPQTFKLPNRTGFDLVQQQDPPAAQEIIQEEENDLTPPTEDNEDTHDPLKPGPPTAADLAATSDVQITPEIQAEAASLNNDPAKMLAFVHDHFFFEPYFGAEKGSQETFFSMGGNDTDQASLLLALLRAAGIPSRYETGVIVVKVDQAENWLSVTDPFVALNILRFNGIPAVGTRKDSTLGSLVFQHTWVIAFLHRRWVRMDPSFKQYTFYSGVNPLGLGGFNINTFESDVQSGATFNGENAYFTSANFNSANSYLQNVLTTMINAIKTTYPNFTLGQLFGGRAIIPADVAKLEKELLGSGKPSVLPYRVKKLLAISDDIPASAHFTASFSIGGVALNANVEDLVNKKVWIEYQPATPQDAAIIQAAGGIFNVIPAYIVNMVPVLKVENQTIGTGNPVPLGSPQILTSTFLEPNFFPDSNQKVLFAGATYAIGLDAQRGFINPALSQRIAQASNIITSGQPITTDVISDLLFITGKAYFLFSDIASEGAAKQTNVVWSRSPEEAVTDNDVSVIFVSGLPVQVLPGGYSIDIKRNVVSPFSKTGNPNDVLGWMGASGSTGSANEDLINQIIHDVPSVSTMAIIKLASDSGIPVHLIVSANAQQILPLLQINPAIKQFIADVVASGFFVIVPRTNVTLNQWSGVGFIVLDPNTGAASYFIAGGIGSQTQIENGGATSLGSPTVFDPNSVNPGVQVGLNSFQQASLDANSGTPCDGAELQQALQIKVKGTQSAANTAGGLGAIQIFAGVLSFALIRSGKPLAGALVAFAGRYWATLGAFAETDTAALGRERVEQEIQACPP